MRLPPIGTDVEVWIDLGRSGWQVHVGKLVAASAGDVEIALGPKRGSVLIPRSRIESVDVLTDEVRKRWETRP